MQNFAKKKKKKGFTLIELLVVIAIIGILATIVIVNVNAARNKAKDAVVKGNMDQLRVTTEMYYDGTGAGTYTNFCGTSCTTGSADWQQICAAIATQNGGTAPTCVSEAQAYCVSALGMPNTNIYCRDSAGKLGVSTCSTSPYHCN
jgi:prepilin-type N-terminal cleavage/methylation domain-containing protein